MAISLGDAEEMEIGLTPNHPRKIKKCISVRMGVAALHHWPDIPATHPMQFLKYPHRHIFQIVASWPVSEANRELEFFVMQGHLNLAVKELLTDKGHTLPSFGAMSCEHIAEALLEKLNCCYVSVSEDGENGAEVWVEGER